MLATTHVLTGAIGGHLVINPLMSFITGIALHLIIFDKIPHFWPTKKNYKTIIFYLDWTLASLIIIYFFITAKTMGSILGATGGFLVDVVIISIPIIYKSKLGRWHTERQPHRTSPIFLLTDTIVILISSFLLWLFLV